MANGAVRSDYKSGGNLMLVPLEPEKSAASEKTSTPVNYIGCDGNTMYGWKYQAQGHGRAAVRDRALPLPQGRFPK